MDVFNRICGIFQDGYYLGMVASIWISMALSFYLLSPRKCLRKSKFFFLFIFLMDVGVVALIAMNFAVLIYGCVDYLVLNFDLSSHFADEKNVYIILTFSIYFLLFVVVSLFFYVYFYFGRMKILRVMKRLMDSPIGNVLFWVVIATYICTCLRTFVEWKFYEHMMSRGEAGWTSYLIEYIGYGVAQYVSYGFGVSENRHWDAPYYGMLTKDEVVILELETPVMQLGFFKKHYHKHQKYYYISLLALVLFLVNYAVISKTVKIKEKIERKNEEIKSLSDFLTQMNARLCPECLKFGIRGVEGEEEVYDEENN